MGTYYKHTKTESIDVPYSFRCEQCLKESGTLKATIHGPEAEFNSNFKEINYDRQEKLAKKAYENLVKKVKETYKDATEKQIYSTEFKDECPFCHKPQSWAVSGLKKDMFTTPIVCAVIGLILAAGCYFFAEVDNNLAVALAVAAVFLAAAVVIFIVNLVKIGSKMKKTSSSTQRNLPVIEWSAVQRILNE